MEFRPPSAAGTAQGATTALLNDAPDYAQIFKTQARSQRDSPITASLLRGAATDVAVASGATAKMLAEVIDRAGRGGRILIADELPRRLAAALHLGALEGDSALSEIYPSAGGSGALHEVWPVAREQIEADPQRIIAAMLRPVRRSDPARAAMLLTGLGFIGQSRPEPVRLFDVGAGAGLLLAADKYQITSYGESSGPADSLVHLEQPWMTPPAIDVHQAPPIAHRLGADLSPLNPADRDDVRQLLAWAGPDATAHLARIESACAVAAGLDLKIGAVPASVWLPRQISWPRTDAHSVIWHSDLVLDLTAPERTEFAGAILAAGARATQTAPLTVCSFEPIGADHLLYRDPVGTALRHGQGRIDPSVFELRVTSWPAGESTVLATAEPSGLNARWAA